MKQLIDVKEYSTTLQLQKKVNNLLQKEDDYIIKIKQNYYTIFFITSKGKVFLSGLTYYFELSGGVDLIEMKYFKNQKVLDVETNNFLTIFLTESYYNIHIFSSHLEAEPFDQRRNYNVQQIPLVSKVKLTNDCIYLLNHVGVHNCKYNRYSKNEIKFTLIHKCDEIILDFEVIRNHGNFLKKSGNLDISINNDVLKDVKKISSAQDVMLILLKSGKFLIRKPSKGINVDGLVSYDDKYCVFECLEKEIISDFSHWNFEFIFLTASKKIYQIGKRFSNSYQNNDKFCVFDSSQYNYFFVGESMTCMMTLPDENKEKDLLLEKLKNDRFTDILFVVK
eukprot:gene6549-10555_t